MTWYDELPADDLARWQKILDTTPIGQEAMRHANGDNGYALFLAAADVKARKSTGVSIWDLADYCWNDAYQDGLNPAQALNDALAAEGL